ncbi:MAG: hypothetical protein AB1938_03615 [Myxococcota bacterium]
MRRAIFAASVGLALWACPQAPQGKGLPPETFCPGRDGCARGLGGGLKAGLAAVSIAPAGWERPRPDYLERAGDCPEGSPLGADGQPRCGSLVPEAFRDCGHDARCPGGAGYVAPDADGSEGDGRPDWFLDCGRDRRCPSEPGYAGPDADGSEGDGVFQGFTLAGFGNNTVMDGVHDPPQARAVALENGDVAVALVSVDAVGLFRDDVERIRRRAAQLMPEGGLDYILVSATHTHEAPDTMGQWGLREVLVPRRGVDDTWMTEVVVEGAARAAVDAYRSRRAARLFATQVRLGDVVREVLFDQRDPFVHDDAVTVLKLVEKEGGAVLGSVVSWGNHPETLADTNNLASADFAWALREAMERGVYDASGRLLAAGLGGTAVYLQGSVGGMQSSLHASPTDVSGQPTRARSFAKARAVGEKVALVALSGAAQAPELVDPPLAFGAQTVKLRVENEAFQLAFATFRLIKRRLYDFDPEKPISETNYPLILTEVAKVQVGGLRLVAVPGELLPELAVGYDAAWAFGFPQVKPTNPNPPNLAAAPAGPYLKDLLGGELNCVVGLANDELGYLIPPYDYVLHPERPYFEEAPGDHYEETNSLGPSATPALWEAWKALLSWEPVP